MVVPGGLAERHDAGAHGPAPADQHAAEPHQICEDCRASLARPPAETGGLHGPAPNHAEPDQRVQEVPFRVPAQVEGSRSAFNAVSPCVC